MTKVNDLYGYAQAIGLNDEQILQEALLLVSGLLEKNSPTKEVLYLNLDLWVEKLQDIAFKANREA